MVETLCAHSMQCRYNVLIHPHVDVHTHACVHTGINAVFYYSASFFAGAGVEDPWIGVSYCVNMFYVLREFHSFVPTFLLVRAYMHVHSQHSTSVTAYYSPHACIYCTFIDVIGGAGSCSQCGWNRCGSIRDRSRR